MSARIDGELIITRNATTLTGSPHWKREQYDYVWKGGDTATITHNMLEQLKADGVIAPNTEFAVGKTIKLAMWRVRLLEHLGSEGKGVWTIRRQS